MAAARLWGVSEALREELGTPRTPEARVDQVRAIAQAAARSEGEAFAASWAGGRAMTRAEALEFAIGVAHGHAEPTLG